MPSEAPSQEAIRNWLAGVQEQLAAVHAQLAPLLVEQRRLEAQQRLLGDLLNELDRSGTVKAAAPLADNSINGSNSLGATGRYVIDRAIEILNEAGQALHI